MRRSSSASSTSNRRRSRRSRREEDEIQELKRRRACSFSGKKMGGKERGSEGRRDAGQTVLFCVVVLEKGELELCVEG